MPGATRHVIQLEQTLVGAQRVDAWVPAGADSPAAIGTATKRPLLHDYSGFPRELYSLRYEAEVANDLVARIAAR